MGWLKFFIFSAKSRKMVEDVTTVTEKTRVILKITVNKEVREYVGRGDNIRTAKRAAAKFALRDLDCHEFFI
jgi:dsRNA-specific ribonuclease